MVPRPFWLEKILTAWKKRPIVWLSGVRQIGKTTLAHMVEDSLFLNCDLPSSARKVADPEPFFEGVGKGKRIIFDEIHKLTDPSQVLKIAADAYPGLRILATGSSTLSATRKFRDTLTGRKTTLYLPPVLWTESRAEFSLPDPDRRLLHGGLPASLLSESFEPAFFSEWMDSYYARDIQELFQIRSRAGFLKLLHLLLAQSGGQLDYTKLAKESELSRPTVKAYLDAMQLSHAIFLLPPFFGGGKREYVHRPKCYGFDTGFVCFAKGWESLRPEDKGVLWEHCVLDVLRTVFLPERIHYWRDKSGRELDFVVAQGSRSVSVYECKYHPDAFEADALATFRQAYPNGENFLVSPAIREPYRRRMNGLEIQFIPLEVIAGAPKNPFESRP